MEFEVFYIRYVRGWGWRLRRGDVGEGAFCDESEALLREAFRVFVATPESAELATADLDEWQPFARWNGAALVVGRALFGKDAT